MMADEKDNQDGSGPKAGSPGGTPVPDPGQTQPAGSSGQTGNPASAQDLVTQLRQDLETIRKEREEYLNLLQRERADFINYRKRVEEEKKETIFFGQSLLLAKLLPLIDHFERASEHLPADLQEHEWAKGIVQIKALFEKELRDLEVDRIQTVGEPFDSNVHEAMMEVAGPQGQVVAELEAGYLFRGKVLKPAKVSVGKGEDKKGEAQTGKAEDAQDPEETE